MFTTGTFNSTLGVTGATTLTGATTATTISTGGLQAVAIGNATPGTGAFTTLSASGVTSITNGTGTTSSGGTGALVVTGGGSFGGNLFVGGNVFAQNIYGVTQDLITIQDPLIYLQALGNLSTYNYDIGFYSDYTLSGYRHTGLARSYASNTWTFFSNLASEPDVSGINWNDAGIAYDNIKAGTLTLANIGNVINTMGSANIAGNVYTGNINAGGIYGTFYGTVAGFSAASNIGNVANFLNQSNTTTNATYYPLIGNVGGVTANTAPFTNSSFTFNPSTGTLSASIHSGAIAATTITASSTTTLTTATTGGLQAVAIGNVTPGTGVFTTGTFNTATTGGLQAVAIGNVTPGTGVFTTGTFNTATTGGLQAVAIGNATPGSGAFTTITASSTLGVTGATTLTTATTGGLQAVAIGNVTPGTGAFTTLSTSGTFISGGNIVAASGTASTTTTTGALIVTGGIGVSGNLNLGSGANIGGDLLPSANVAYSLGSSSYQWKTLWVSGSTINIGNIPITASGATGIVLGHSLNNTVIGNITPAYAAFTTSNIGGLQAVAIGNVTPGTAAFTTATTGGLQAVAIGNVTPGTAAFTTATAGGLQAVAIGNVTPGTGVFTTGTFNTATTGGLQAVAIGNVTPGTAAFTTATTGGLQAVAIGNVTPGTGVFTTGTFNTATTGGLQAVAIGNATPGSGAFTTITASSTLGVTGATTLTTATTGGLQAVAIGNVTPGTGAFTTVTTSSTIVSSGNIVAGSGTNSTSTTTGAVVINNNGGLGVMGNVFLGNAVTINSSQTAGQDFIVKGKSDATLIWARPGATYDQVIVGNSATTSTLVPGAKFMVNSSDSMMLPVGTISQRPSNQGATDVAGMVRYSTTSNSFEFYNGSSWIAPSTVFTTITSQQFTGTGSQTVFTLSGATTTSSTLVSINGVVQIPGASYSYTISGTSLTFNEAPASTDIIDVRTIATTSTVTSLSSSSGYTLIDVSTDASGIMFYTGTGAATKAFTIPATGGLVTNDSGISVASANTPTTLDTFSSGTYRSAKYVVQVTNGSKYQVSEALVITDGTTATVMAYGTISTSGNLGVLAATQSGANTTLQFIAANATNTVKLFRQYVTV